MKVAPSIAGRLGGQAVLLFAGYVFTLVVGLPLQMYVARRLGASELGIYSLLESGAGLLAGLAAMGIAPVLVRFIPQHLERKEYSSIRKLLGMGASLLLAAGSLSYLLAWLMLPLVHRLWPELAMYSAVTIVMGTLIPLSLLVFFLQQGLRGFQEVRHIVMGSSIMQLSIKALLTVVLLQMGFRLLGFAWAAVGSTLLCCLWLTYVLWRRVQGLPADSQTSGAATFNEWRAYGLLMYGNGLLGVFSQYADRFLLSHFAGAGPVGVLAVLSQLSQIPAVALGVLIATVAPMFASATARGDAVERLHLYHLATDWGMRISLPLLIFFALFADPLLHLYGNEFADSGKLAFWIFTAGVALNLVTGPLGNLLNMSGMAAPLFNLNILQTVLTLIGYCILVPWLGIAGAALNVLLNTMYAAYRGFGLAHQLLDIHWWNKRYLSWMWPSALTILLAIGLRLLWPAAGAVKLVVVVGLLYCGFAAVSLLQGLGDDDRALFAHLGDKLKNVGTKTDGGIPDK